MVYLGIFLSSLYRNLADNEAWLIFLQLLQILLALLAQLKPYIDMLLRLYALYTTASDARDTVNEIIEPEEEPSEGKKGLNRVVGRLTMGRRMSLGMKKASGEAVGADAGTIDI